MAIVTEIRMNIDASHLIPEMLPAFWETIVSFYLAQNKSKRRSAELDKDELRGDSLYKSSHEFGTTRLQSASYRGSPWRFFCFCNKTSETTIASERELQIPKARQPKNETTSESLVKTRLSTPKRYWRANVNSVLVDSNMIVLIARSPQDTHIPCLSGA